MKTNGWVFYDGACRLCAALARRLARPLRRRGFLMARLQEPWVAAHLDLAGSELLEEMRVLTADGRTFGGADAVAHLAGAVWWGWPLRALARLPFGMRFMRKAYRWIARHRSCHARESCSARARVAAKRRYRSARLVAPTLMIASPPVAVLMRSALPAWVVMWTLAASIFAACKWLTWRHAQQKTPASPSLSLGYFFLWPGMDADAFLGPKRRGPRSSTRDWAFAFFKTTFGAALLWRSARIVPSAHPLVAGWVGMLGLIFLLHFGLFHLLALAWQTRGVNAEPIMRFPALATSVAEFWGARWNRGFNDQARRYVFQPLRFRLGAGGAALAVFIASGLIHELVISVPARGGFGLPSLYFLIQGIGVFAERSRAGKWLGLRRGWRGWLFTAAITAGPLCWLFHPLFVLRVIGPFLKAMGAL
jgi:predicted DCC family thiol-disulfide oxidoreductase YuxK